MGPDGGVNIRQATPPDDRLLASLSEETFIEAFGAQNAAADVECHLRNTFSPEKQAAELADPDIDYLVAESTGELAGYACLRIGPPDIFLDAVEPIEIVRLYARRQWIGKGIGSALMSAALQQAADRACDVVWLSTWEKNRRGIDFYRRWGFVTFGEHPFLLGNDLQNDYLMARPVAATADDSARARPAAGRTPLTGQHMPCSPFSCRHPAGRASATDQRGDAPK